MEADHKTYYEAVEIGPRASHYFYCKTCEESNVETLTTTGSEIKMIKHIQTCHPEKKLVLEVPGRKKCKSPEKISNAERPNAPNPEFDLSQVFYVCKICYKVFQQKRNKDEHSLSHDHSYSKLFSLNED